MIRDSRIHSSYAGIVPPADGARVAAGEQVVTPADLFVSDGKSPSGLQSDSGSLTRDLPAPDEGAAPASAGTGSVVSGSVAGCATGPCGTSIAHLLSAVAPSLAHVVELAELQVKERELDQALQELENELAGTEIRDANVPGGAGADAPALLDEKPGVTPLELMWRNVRMLSDQVLTPGEDAEQAPAGLPRADLGILLGVDSERRQPGLDARNRALDEREATLKKDEAALEARKSSVADQVAREVERLEGLREAEFTNSLYAVDDVLRKNFDAQQQELEQARAAEQKRLLDALWARDAELQATLAPGQTRLNELYSQAQQLQCYVAQWEAAIADSRSNASDLAAQLTGAISGAEPEGRQVARDTRALQADIRSLESQVRSVGFQVQAAERKVMDVRSDCDRIRRELASP